MTSIRFYHLQSQNLAQALPGLVTKAYEKGHKIVIKTADERQANELSDMLWTYHDRSFLPHGTAKDGFEAQQPVYLTAGNDNPAQADVLILAGGAPPEDVSSFALCCEMLNGNDEGEVAAARKRWSTYKDAGHDVTYWQQTAQGGWDQKA